MQSGAHLGQDDDSQQQHGGKHWVETIGTGKDTFRCKVEHTGVKMMTVSSYMDRISSMVENTGLEMIGTGKDTFRCKVEHTWVKMTTVSSYMDRISSTVENTGLRRSALARTHSGAGWCTPGTR